MRSATASASDVMQAANAEISRDNPEMLFIAAVAGILDLESGVLDYHDIVANYLPTFTRKFDSEAKVPWLYSATKQIMISYDDVESHNARMKYIKDKSLGGTMIWELSGDTKEKTLGKAIRSALTP